jgi:uncharacterized RDD family membrane protein YckC
MDDKRYISIDYASFWRRFGAILIDGLIIGLADMIILKASDINAFSILIVILIDFSYEIFSIYHNGMTIGKKALKIRVISTLGDKLTLKQAFIRYFSKTLSETFLSIGYLWMLFNDNRQTWHDKLASTIVILRENEDLIIEKLDNSPWEESQKLKRIRIGALILTTLIFTGGVLNSFVNDVGMFGLHKVNSITINETIKDMKFLDVDGNGSKDMISIVAGRNGKVLNIYKGNANKLSIKKSYDIEASPGQDEKNDWGATFELADLDNDKSLELIVTDSEDNANRLMIYKEINGIYKMIDSKEYSTKVYEFNNFFTDIEIHKDDNGNNHIIWIYDTVGKPRMYSYRLSEGKLKEDFYEVIEELGRIISGDFDGDNKKELYLISEDLDEVTINRLEYSDKAVKLHKEENIKSWSTMLNSINNAHEVKVDDFDGDGRDDIIFLTLTGQASFMRKEDIWLKVYTRKEDKWQGIWCGGKSKENDMYATEYQGNCDINDDGIKDIIITKNHMANLFFKFEEKEDIDFNNIIEVYNIDPIKFAINKFWQRVWYFQ